MGDALKELLAAGKKLLVDTKARRPAKDEKKPATKDLVAPAETDPLKIFIRRCISEKPKKAEVVEEMKKFIKIAEDNI